MIKKNNKQQNPIMKLDTEPERTTGISSTINNVGAMVTENLETEYTDYYNKNSNINDLHKKNVLQQQKQQIFEVNLPNLPTGTTITPAPPIAPKTTTTEITDYQTTTATTTTIGGGAIKTGKKRGRKPGSKNQPKLTLQQKQILILQQHLPPSLGDLMGNIRMNDQVNKLFKPPSSSSSSPFTPPIFNQPMYGHHTHTHTHTQDSSLIGGAIDLTTTTAQTQPINNYLMPHQPQQSPFNATVHFNPANLYPYAATARPGLIPGGGMPFYTPPPPPPPPPQTQQQQQQQTNIPMDFLKQYKQQHDNYLLPQQPQQQQQQAMVKNNNNNNNNNGEIYKSICNIPPLLPEHLKIAAQQQHNIQQKPSQSSIQQQQQQNKQQPVGKKGKNLTPSETIDLLSDDSNDHLSEINSKLQLQKHHKQQQQQQQYLYSLQQELQPNNNRKSMKKQLQQDMLIMSSLQQQPSVLVPPISKLAGGADLIPLTNTGLAYSSQNIPHTSLTGGGCQLGGTVDTLLGDITITKTTTTSNNSVAINEQQQQQQQDEQLLLLKKNKHSKKDKKIKKIKEGKINKKNKKEKKDKDKRHKLEKILLKHQHKQHQQHQQHQLQPQQENDNNIMDERELLKKQKREKKREKQRRMSNLNEMGEASPSNTASSPLIPKLTLKLAGKNSPITTMSPKTTTTTTTTTKEQLTIVENIGEEEQNQYQQLSREYSPELAKFSPLVTRPPKQKATLPTKSPTPPPPAPPSQQQQEAMVVPPPPPSSWTSGDTFPASSVLLPSQLFGGCNDTPILPATSSSSSTITKIKDNAMILPKTPSNVDFINDIKPHSYVVSN